MQEAYTADIGSKESLSLAKLSSEDLSHGLVIRSVNWLGDAVMTLPAADALAKLTPSQTVCIVCPKKLKSFWAAFPWVDKVIAMQGKRTSKKEKQAIRDYGAKAGVIFPNSTGSALDLRSCGLRKLIGRRGRLRSLLLNQTLPAWKRIPGEDRYHQLREYLQLAQFCGSEQWDSQFRPAKADVKKNFLDELGIQTEEKYLVIAPGAAFGPAKQWPIEYYAQSATAVMKSGYKVVLVGAPGEEAVAKEVENLAPGIINLAGETSVQELMFLLEHSHYCLVNDSGAMHLAAAVGASGSAFFGSTTAIATGPLGDDWTVFYTKESCSPCLQRQCLLEAKEAYKCLRNIKAEIVITKLKELFTS